MGLPAHPSHQAQHPLTPGIGQQVLVVEDDKDIRETVAELLHSEGYTVFEAPNGKPGLARLKKSSERMVVVLDLQMPGMDGREMLEAVAAHPGLADRHAFVLVTANQRTLPLSFVMLLTQMRVAVVAKPFDVEELLDAVAQAAARLAG